MDSNTYPPTLLSQTGLLQECFTRLLAIVATPISSLTDERQDLPQVHAMHILKAVVQEACVSHPVLPYVAQATRRTLDALASPHWAVRNAATQLFGDHLCSTLSPR